MNRIAALALLTALGLPVSAETVPAPANSEAVDAAAVLKAAQAKAQEVAKARAAHVEAGNPSSTFRVDLGRERAVLVARLRKETRPLVRQALIVTQLYHDRLARQTPPAPLLALALKEVPATAAAWAVDKDLLLALEGWAPEASAAYLAQARAGHPDAGLRRNLLFAHFTVMIDTGTEAGWRPPFEVLQKVFPGSPEALKAQDRLASELKTAVGIPAPAFSVPSLEDPAQRFTLATFKGSYVLLDFWATWCPDCHAEMPVLHQAYARFQAKGLQILSLSFDRKVEHIAPYRTHAATPMPWKHAFLEGGFKNPLSLAYGVKSIPKPVLVGPDGRIVANGGDLHGAKLAQTLEKFLGQ